MQFIKVHNPDVIHHNFLWMVITRGIAIMCKDNQHGINLVIPFLYWDTLLHRTNVSAILAQVKNDAMYMNAPRLNLFHGINPFELWFFNDNVKYPVPIIQMVFALVARMSIKTPTETFVVIEQDAMYKQLLKLCNIFPDVYASSDAEDIRKIK